MRPPVSKSSNSVNLMRNEHSEAAKQKNIKIAEEKRFGKK
jgi:hypothetical protein